ncbi:hypothetical protein D0962_04275 [Leptolyngbyaceae cyanobacterium CCMR0082]|uniref:Uncharacterized protein n=1 Tax=Adonisia turfae CCMR0082 TaxID=2304604 RepID=A0A6M0S0L6_9CYAN|nr:hypothetical protein [Adonisia turfae]NEZ61997.1 hypothetical protein [Adonisia turfae CCMR0082]
MPKRAQEITLHNSLYASPQGWASVLFLQIRKLPASAYQYQVVKMDTSDVLLPDELARFVFESWWENYNNPAMRRRGGVHPINHLYCNTLHYKDDIRHVFNQAKLKGYQGQDKPLLGEWKYYQVQRWNKVEGLAGDTLQSALLNLSAAINTGQLKVNPDVATQLREEMKDDYDWEVGVKTMPITLAAFVQAFSQMPLKVRATAAQAYLRGGWV